MELLERDGALAELDRLLADTAGGGRVALVAGEAGAGKSSLAAAFAARVGRRARILSGACDPLLTPRALGPVHDIARQTGGVLRERVAGGERGAVFDALLDELDGPLPGRRAVVVLEDLHWADEATLDLVAFLGRRLAVCRALLLLTYRDDELGPGHQLRAVLAGLPRGPVRRIALPPLSAGAVAELARRAGRPPAAVHSVTGGNPLLVTEVLAGAETGVPATVRDLVLSRLAALSPAARAAAGLVAVVPSHAESALLEGHAEGVEEGLAGGVLTGSADAVGFRHELLRRAVEESLSPVRRAALHAEVLDRLAGRPGVDPARLVHHAHHAGDAASVLRWAPVAARRAAEVGAHRQAAAHYETALRHAAGVTGPARAGLLEAYATVAHLAGLNGEGLGARQEALALREAAGDTVRIGENLRWVSRLAWWSGRTAQAREAGTRAVEVLEAAGPGPQLAMAYSNMAQLDMLADADTALGWGERAVALARELGDLDTEAHARVTIGSFRLQRGDPAGGEELDRVHRTAAAAGLTDHAARALVNRACQAVEWHQPGLAEDVLERALAYTDARDLGGYVRHLLGYRAVLRLARGDWPGAAEDAGQAIAGPDQPGPFRCPAQVTLGRLRSRRGLPGAEEVLGEAAAAAYEADELQFVGPVAAALAEHHWIAGDPGRSAAEAQRGYRMAVASGHPWLAGELAFRLWRSGAAASSDGIAAPYRLLLEGDVRGAAEQWAWLGYDYARAEALACGDDEDAAEAVRIMDGLGAVAAARRVRAELRDRGAKVPRGPRAATAADPTGLTARQREVLELLAEGLSNAQIAAALSLSAKTVDHHVSAVLGKLGVTSRGQAAAAARRAAGPR
ncbi:ATP-binding protein [Pseudosporangium ferrugineum]|uniref:LuxR family transcriptional regulator n=1 Tax=Pseudosporangium ferrugineum TaxID=439699 RepID=A0A2T0RHC1_9ACTN|nr:helix-turn-helix transcriptional regulator [Pseudosporangium ferrugineum]PRY20537.1 LuxR family transcriptional regulator [Pseudosporangium ferrugineum]